MPAYRGKALQPARSARRGSRPLRIALRVVGLVLAVALLSHVPWSALLRRFFRVTEVRVEGLRYLDAERVQAIAGIRRGDDLLRLDLRRARQALLLDSRIAGAKLERRPPRGVRVTIEERRPALLVHHGTPWELDEKGVVLEPLDRGVVADVPLLVGPDLHAVPAGTQVSSAPVARGLAWAEALGAPALQLAGQVSELDVSREDRTTLTLLDGTRVLASPWPPRRPRLSALRVVLADLKQKGLLADEVDVRFDDQVIVRPAAMPRTGQEQG